MYKINTTILLTWVAISLLNNQVMAHENPKLYNISSTSKSLLDSRLSSFLDTVDNYNSAEQIKIYENLQSRIARYESKYSVGSDMYSMLQIIDTIADHKLDSDSILTNDEILSHIIYWNKFGHYAETPVTDTPETEIEIDEEIDSQEAENQNEYRSDLDTDELNEVDKNILAGSAKWVLQIEVRANLEGIKSEKVEFRFNENIDNIGLIGKLYHDGILIWESSESDARGTVLTIDNISNFTIGTDTSNVQLELVTKAIGKELVWRTLENIRVVSTTFKDNTWVITGDKVWDRTDNQNSKNFSIVPADILVSTEIEFEKYVSTANIKIIPSVGNNNENGSIFSTSLESITLQVSSFSQAWSVSIFNSNGVQIWTGNITSAWKTTIAVDSDKISSSGEVYRISTTAEGIFIISQDGIWYSAGGETYVSKLAKQIYLGQR